jgi:uncharacterized protein (DUF1015 family)
MIIVQNIRPIFLADGGLIKTNEKLWAVDDPQFIRDVSGAFKGKKIYIADGHHRYETALAYRNELRAKNPNHTGDELYNYVMMTIVEMEGSRPGYSPNS